jgi:hypothetical protein
MFDMSDDQKPAAVRLEESAGDLTRSTKGETNQVAVPPWPDVPITTTKDGDVPSAATTTTTPTPMAGDMSGTTTASTTMVADIPTTTTTATTPLSLDAPATTTTTSPMVANIPTSTATATTPLSLDAPGTTTTTSSSPMDNIDAVPAKEGMSSDVPTSTTTPMVENALSTKNKNKNKKGKKRL